MYYVLKGIIYQCESERSAQKKGNSEIFRESEESSTPVQLDVISWISLSADDAARKEYSKTPAEYTLPELDTVTVRFDGKRMQCLYEQDEVYDLPLQELINAYFADLNGDGIRELCVTAKTTEPWDDAFDTLSYRGWAYDLVSKQLYSTVPSSEQGFGWVLRTYDNEMYAFPWSYVQYVYAEPCKIVLNEDADTLRKKEKASIKIITSMLAATVASTVQQNKPLSLKK